SLKPQPAQLLLLHRQLPRSPPGEVASWRQRRAQAAVVAAPPAGGSVGSDSRPRVDRSNKRRRAREIVGGSGLVDCGSSMAGAAAAGSQAMVKPGLRTASRLARWQRETAAISMLTRRPARCTADLPDDGAGFRWRDRRPSLRLLRRLPTALPQLRHDTATGETVSDSSTIRTPANTAPAASEVAPAAALAAGPSSSASPASTSGLKRRSKPDSDKASATSAASAASATRHHRHQTPGPSSGVSSESSSVKQAQAQVPPRVANGGGSSVAAVVRPFSSFDAHTLNRMAPGIRQRNISRTREQIQSSGVTKATWQNSSVVVQALWAGRYACVSPYDFKHTIGRHAEAFAGNESRTPGGQFKSTLVCEQCHYKSITFDAFMYLSLPVVSDTSCRLSAAAAGSAPLPSRSERREEDRHLAPAAAYLLIHFKRFRLRSVEQSRPESSTPWLTIPSANLDMSAYHSLRGQAKALSGFTICTECPNTSAAWECGHYTAFCRNSNLNRWFKFDDETVTEMRSGEIRSAATEAAAAAPSRQVRRRRDPGALLLVSP
uniref:ubiquitinyl hydrolase 1 n=1 Tax=Macrostomum lignano TaxID=282301 RepID=A0A1I8FKZ9_9PLAT